MSNLEIVQQRKQKMNEIEGPRVGDYLKLPYGIYTRFTHKWPDSLQTGGYQNSFYLNRNGGISYSGGLDSGVKITDIQPTDETKKGFVWIFHNDIAGAGRGVDVEIDFRVFSLKDGADTSGIPQIAAYEKAEYLKTIEQLTLINGNGQPYSLPLPEIAINCKTINEHGIKRIEENTGLKFEKGFFGYVCQPVNSAQIVKLFCTYNFKSKFYNNHTFKNTLVLDFND